MAVLDVLGALVDLLSGIEALAVLVSPWRYLVSPHYRQRKRLEWKTAPRHRVQLEITGGIFLALLTLALIGFVVALIVSTPQAPQ